MHLSDIPRLFFAKKHFRLFPALCVLSTSIDSTRYSSDDVCCCVVGCSFPACYSAEFSELKPCSDGGGVPLEHLIGCVPGVHVAVSKSGVKKVLWAENKPLQPIGKVLWVKPVFLFLVRRCLL